MSYQVYLVSPGSNIWETVAQSDSEAAAKEAARRAQAERSIGHRSVAVVWSAAGQGLFWALDEDGNERIPNIVFRSAGEGGGLRGDFVGFKD